MKPSLFKKALSFIWDIQVDYRSSDINGDLIVYLTKGRYQLCTAHAIYSFEDRYDNFGNIFRYHIDFDALPGNKVLILGLGLGSIPILLDQLRPGAWDFTAVEIDEEICTLAYEYGYPKITSPIQTIIGDAFNFVRTGTEQYDLICIDLFIDDVLPDSCNSSEFLTMVQDSLSPNGAVIANTLAFSEEHRIFSRKFYDDHFSKVFTDATLIHTHLNYMLVSPGKTFTTQQNSDS